MKNPNRYSGWIVGIIIALIVVSAGLFLWKQPLLGKSLTQINTQIAQTQQNQPEATAISEIPIDSTVIPITAPPMVAGVPDAVNTGKPVCGAPDQQLVLALGIDEVAQSDVIRLIRVDYLNQKVIVLSIPRDLYLPLPGFEDHKITTGRINSAYGFGEVYIGRGQGVFATANAFAANFGISFDQYVVGQFSSFIKLVDRVGGIDITLDKAADGTAAGGPVFAAGNHHLDGQDALDLARIRYGDDDFHRIDRQSLVLKALMTKVNDSMNILELTSFGLETIQDKGIQTDLSVSDLYTLACFSKELTAEDVSFVNIPSDLYRSATSTAGGSIILPRDGLVPFVQDLLGVTD